MRLELERVKLTLLISTAIDGGSDKLLYPVTAIVTKLQIYM
jgi:hypothetical protein